MVGSNRQDASVDLQNGLKHGSGSCFAQINRLVTELNARLPDKNERKPIIFNQMLMVDIVHDNKPGTSMNIALDKMLPPLDFKGDDYAQAIKKMEKTSPDETKVSQLYTQMQAIAQKMLANDSIDFTFYDDRKDLLDGVKNYFEKYPDLIPQRVTLKLEYVKPKYPDMIEQNTTTIKQLTELIPKPDINEEQINQLEVDTGLKKWLSENLGKDKKESRDRVLNKHLVDLTTRKEKDEKTHTEAVKTYITSTVAIKGSGQVNPNFEVTAKTMLSMIKRAESQKVFPDKHPQQYLKDEALTDLKNTFNNRAKDPKEYKQKLFGLGARIKDRLCYKPKARSRTNELQVIQKFIDYLEGNDVLGFSPVERLGLEQSPLLQGVYNYMTALNIPDFLKSTETDLYRSENDSMVKKTSPIKTDILKAKVNNYLQAKQKDTTITHDKDTPATQKKHAAKIKLAESLLKHLDNPNQQLTEKSEYNGRIADLYKEVNNWSKEQKQEQEQEQTSSSNFTK